MTSAPNFIDLDEVSPATDVTVRLNGAQHKLVPISVEDFIANTRDQAQLGEISDSDPAAVEKNLNLIIKMLVRSFPTLTEDDLRKIQLSKLWKLLEFAREAGGQEEVEKEAAPADENPPTAG